MVIEERILVAYLDSVVLLDVRVGEADGSSVVRHNVGDLVLSEALSLHLAELEGSFSGVDLDRLEASLNVVKDSVALASLGDGDHIHEAKREAGVSAHAVINLDVGVSRSADLEGFLTVQSVSEAVSEEHREGDALSEFVGTG